jgi:hypothetical protein
MQARAIAAREEQESPRQPAFEYSAQPATSRSGINPGTKVTLQAEPAFRGVFSFGAPGD